MKTALLVALVAFGLSQDDTDLKKKVEDLESRLKKLEEQKQTQQEKKTETTFDEGFWTVGKDDKLRVGASGQFDGRFFLDNTEGDSNFLIRRARVFATGMLETYYNYMIMGKWDQQTPALHFAWLEDQHLPYARVRIGLFKEPFSMEGLHSDHYWDFDERSLTIANLLQLEDIGAMVSGKFLEDRIEYGVGIFNGRARTPDNNANKEFVTRIVVSPLNKLFLGASYSTSTQKESLAAQTFKTGAGTTIWTWASSTKVDDTRERKGADIEWICGPVAVRAEYLAVDWGNIQRNASLEKFTSSGWFIEASWVMTGEDVRRNKNVLPKKNFDPAAGGWGAWQLAARYESFKLDDGVLDKGLATGTDKINGFTAGVNCYMNPHVQLKIDWQRIEFDDPIFFGNEKNNSESVIFVRWQFEL